MGSVVRRALTPVKIMVYAAILISIASTYAWWHYIYNAQDNVFWDMVRSNLSTSSYARRTVEDQGVQSQTQATVTQMGPEHLLNSQSILVQAQPKTRVVTDYIGTPYEDYVRYASIDTEQKGLNGKPLDTSSVEGKWGKTPSMGKSETSGQMYSESVLSVIPFGKLPYVQREAILHAMQSSGVYTFELKKVERTTHWTRPTYVYDVQINAETYVTVLKQFARYAGLTQLERLDPAQYKSAQPIGVTVRIDGWSHQLTQVDYNSGARVENISSHGTQQQLWQPPKDAIGVDELQSKLQSLR